MQWKNTRFKFKETAELMKADLDQEGIKADGPWPDEEGYWYVSYMPMGKEQERKALQIVCAHID